LRAQARAIAACGRKSQNLLLRSQTKGKIEIFSLDALVNMATSAGMRVGLSIQPKTSVKAQAAAPATGALVTKQRLRAAG